jgi:hypothetical protein
LAALDTAAVNGPGRRHRKPDGQRHGQQDLFRRSGYEILESYPYMLKPFSNEQMAKLDLGWPIIDALFEIGKEHPDLASHLFIRARRGSHDQQSLAR